MGAISNRTSSERKGACLHCIRGEGSKSSGKWREYEIGVDKSAVPTEVSARIFEEIEEAFNQVACVVKH
jgi:hypothetical protein